jgi:DNA mismatch endonuclease, patch repair protein
MTDIVSEAVRSELMSRIRSKNTTPEKVVRSVLHRMGYRFRLHVKELMGRPDIVLPRFRTVVFVHGCFWHRHTGCKLAYNPKSRVEFWQEKFEQNILRDAKVREGLKKEGWRIVVVWECELSNLHLLEKRIRKILPNGKGPILQRPSAKSRTQDRQ